jgi:hypothetical protein
MRPPNGMAPHGAVNAKGAEASNEREKSSTSNGRVVLWPVSCVNCEVSFRPRRPSHTLCGRCFQWARIEALVRETKRSIQKAAG